MVCIETGDVIEFVNEDIEKIQHDIAREHNYEIVDHNLVLYVRPVAKKGES
jgi:Fur family ferric uptake transcriptional regulator